MFFVPSGSPRRFDPAKPYPLERYLDFLPLEALDSIGALGEGGTPLLELCRLGPIPGSPRVLAKNETVNPTYSFKDRGTVVAVQKALALGIRNIGTVSTGNMAASTAAYGARAGLRTFILVKEDTTEEKLLAAAAYGPTLIRVRGEYGELFRMSYSLGRKHGIFFMNSVDPCRLEGYKVTGFEIFHQLAGRPPDYIIVPLSSGGHLLGLMRAFLDLRDEGIISKLPTVVGVQAAGCAPLALAFRQKKARHETFRSPQTICQAISNADPPGGHIVLKMISEHNGLILDVSDEEILAGHRRLAEREGLFCLPDSATALAALLKLAVERRLTRDDTVVLVLTGAGLKNLAVLEKRSVSVPVVPLPELGRTLGRAVRRS